MAAGGTRSTRSVGHHRGNTTPLIGAVHRTVIVRLPRSMAGRHAAIPPLTEEAAHSSRSAGRAATWVPAIGRQPQAAAMAPPGRQIVQQRVIVRRVPIVHPADRIALATGAFPGALTEAVHLAAAVVIAAAGLGLAAAGVLPAWAAAAAGEAAEVIA